MKNFTPRDFTTQMKLTNPMKNQKFEIDYEKENVNKRYFIETLNS